MTFFELDVQEVLEGYPPPPAMTRGSRVEVVRRLDERARQRREPVLSRPVLAAMLRVTTRSIERYRRDLRDDTLG